MGCDAAKEQNLPTLLCFFETNNDEQKDEYPNGDPEGKDIKEMIGKFAKFKISLFFWN